VVYIANRYWNPATNPANTDATSSWSASDGGATGETVPTSSDDVFFTNTNNNNCVINATISVKSIDFTGGTGYTGTLSGTGSLIVFNGVLKLNGGMTYSYTGQISTRTTNITTNSISVKSRLSVGAGITTFEDNFDNSTASGSDIVLGGSANNQTMDLNGKTVKTLTFSISSSSYNTVIFNGGTAECTRWAFGDNANLTADTGILNILTATNQIIGTGGKTYNIVNIESAGNIVFDYAIAGGGTIATLNLIGRNADRQNILIDCDLTITDLSITGTSASRPVFVFSPLRIQRTLTLTNVPTLEYVNFMDINLVGEDEPYSGTSLGDAGNNDGITFGAGVTRYWVTDGTTSSGNYNDTAYWSASSGGAGGQSVPLPHDTIKLDANSIDTTGRTITFNYSPIGDIDFTGITNTPAISISANIIFTNNIKFVSGMTESGVLNLYVSSNKTFTTGGISFSNSVNFNSISGYTITTSGNLVLAGGVTLIKGNLTLGGNVTAGASFILTSGTFDANDYNLTGSTFSSSNTNTRSVYLGSGTATFTGTANAWNVATSTNFTFDAETSTIILNNVSSSNKTFAGGGLTYNNVQFTGAGTGTFTITGANTFNTLTIDTAPKSVIFTKDITQTMTNFVANGLGANLITMYSNTAGSKWTISVASGTIECTKVSLKDSTATGGATFNAINSTDVSGNSGWNFLTTGSTGGLINLRSCL